MAISILQPQNSLHLVKKTLKRKTYVRDYVFFQIKNDKPTKTKKLKPLPDFLKFNMCLRISSTFAHPQFRGSI